MRPMMMMEQKTPTVKRKQHCPTFSPCPQRKEEKQREIWNNNEMESSKRFGCMHGCVREDVAVLWL
jgi:hypothetical protein